jgi:hypothetical protein
MALSARNARRPAPVLPSPLRGSPAAPAGSSLKPAERDLLDLQRSAGNRAVSLVVQREATEEAGYKIISEVYEVSGRPMLVVATGQGDQVLFFYKRTGAGNKGVGVAPPPDSWTPFKTLMAQDESMLGKEIEVHSKGSKVRFPDPDSVDKLGRPKHANPKKAWLNKQPYYSQVENWDPKRGYANQRNQDIGHWLDDLDKQKKIPEPQKMHWEDVEQKMDQVANDYRAKVRASSGSSGTGSGTVGQHGAEQAGEAEAKVVGAEIKGAGAEVKGAGLEAKAAGAEAKALGSEAKLIGAEVTGALKTENVLTKGAQLAAKGAKVARISELLIALGMPGPQDVFFMFIAAFASIAEAKAKLRADAYATGFAQGLAAAITWTKGEDAMDMLYYKVADPSVGEISSGWVGNREKGTNDGIAAGWKFGKNLNGTQSMAMRHLALDATGIKEKRHSNRNELIALGAALKPTVLELFAEAERQQHAKEVLEEAERRRYHPLR